VGRVRESFRPREPTHWAAKFEGRNSWVPGAVFGHVAILHIPMCVPDLALPEDPSVSSETFLGGRAASQTAHRVPSEGLQDEPPPRWGWVVESNPAPIRRLLREGPGDA
jgi:hypothetical protein